MAAVSVASANAGVAVITTGTVTNLTSTSASIASMNAGVALLTTATVTSLTATGASVASANVGTAVVTGLTVTGASIASVNAGVAVLSGNLTLNGGTANGVAYLNGSKVLTSGSALQFDGTGKLALGNVAHTSFIPATALTLGNSAANVEIRIGQQDTKALILKWVYNATVGSAYGAIETYGQTNYIQFGASDFRWQIASTQAMTLDASGALLVGNTANYSVGSAENNSVQVKGPIVLAANNTGSADNRNWVFQTNAAAAGAFSLAYSSTNTGWPNAAYAMVVDKSGNLGIATTSPGYKLDVNNGGGSIAGFRVSGNDQANVRMRLENSGSGGRTWELVGGLPGVNNANFSIRDVTGSTTPLTIDSSGNLGIATTSPASKLHVAGNIQIGAGNDLRFSSTAYITPEDNVSGARIVTPGLIGFHAGGSERGRFSAEGYFKASNAGTYVNATSTYHELRNTANETACLMSCSNTGFTSSVLSLTAYPVSGTGFKHLICRSDNGNDEVMNIRGDGNLYNDNGVYGTISDERLKQDIVDAPSQWDDIKAVRFRKYRMKSDVEADPNAPSLLGVVAQELEQTSPGLVDDGEIKTVKSSILLMKAAVALQEAMARIEQLEAKVAALESA